MMRLSCCLFIFCLISTLTAMERNHLTVQQEEAKSKVNFTFDGPLPEAQKTASLFQALIKAEHQEVQQWLNQIDTKKATPKTKRKLICAAIASNDPAKVSTSLDILKQKGLSLASLSEEDRDTILTKALQDDMRSKKSDSPEHRLLVTLVANYETNAEKVDQNIANEDEAVLLQLLQQPLSNIFPELQNEDYAPEEAMEL